MTRHLYAMLLRLHPGPFRDRFAAEMAGIPEGNRSRGWRACTGGGGLAHFRRWPFAAWAVPGVDRVRLPHSGDHT